MRRPPLLVLCLLAVACPARAQSGGAVQAVSDTYDFGCRSVLDQSPISHTFVLKAGVGSAVVVDRLQPSCHCTRAIVMGGANGDGRFAIPPGGTVGVSVTVNPSDMAPGVVEKDVYVFVNGGSTPGAVLHVRGTITPPVVFSTAVLDFGAADAGATRTRLVTVTIDPRLLSPGQSARLVCSDARLQVERLAPVSQPAGSQAYRVTVPTGMPPGRLRASLSVALSPQRPALESPWSVPVRVEVLAPGQAPDRTGTIPTER